MQTQLNQIIMNLKEHQKTLPRDVRVYKYNSNGSSNVTINEKSPIRNKYQDMGSVIDILEAIKLVDVDHETIGFLQYGMFFDGGDKLYYDKKIVEVMDIRVLQAALLNQIFHFLMGAHFNTGTPGKFCLSSSALYFAHLRLINIKPKYAQSVREEFYDKYVKDEIDFIFYKPLKGIGKYHIEKFINGEINYPTSYGLEITKEFPIDTGTIFETSQVLGYLTQSGGMGETRHNGRRIIGIRQPNGRLKFTTAQNKTAKELVGIKKTIDVMFEEA